MSQAIQGLLKFRALFLVFEDNQFYDLISM